MESKPNAEPSPLRATLAPLAVRDVPADPLTLFTSWFDLARSSVPEPENMTLATASADGAPSARMVLLRGFDIRGFVFFTNYESRKGRELEANPLAALVLFWSPLGRQVRIEGPVTCVSAAESDAYFDTRPVASRLSAIASPQSSVIEGREVLEAKARALANEYRHGHVPRPANWGGYRVEHQVIEFWQQGSHRLHDRLRYRRDGERWIVERLAP